jgi:hypothetical protein
MNDQGTMLKTDKTQAEMTEDEARSYSTVKARAISFGAALAVVALLSGCATGPDGQYTGFRGWWRAQAERQDAAARSAVALDEMR